MINIKVGLSETYFRTTSDQVVKMKNIYQNMHHIKIGWQPQGDIMGGVVEVN